MFRFGVEMEWLSALSSNARFYGKNFPRHRAVTTVAIFIYYTRRYSSRFITRERKKGSKEGRNEGRKEGRKIGRKEGRKEERKEG